MSAGKFKTEEEADAFRKKHKSPWEDLLAAKKEIALLKKQRDEARTLAEKWWAEADDHNGHCGGMPLKPLPWEKS